MGTCRGMAAQTPSSEMLTGWETAGMRCSLSKLFPSHCATPCPSQHMWRAHTGTGTGKQTAPVSDLTICYLSLHCCSAFTFLVVISHTDKTIFSNTCFVIWFFFFLHTVIFTLITMSEKRHQISILKNKNHSYLDYYLQNVKLQETHLKHNAWSYISILKGHLNLGGKMWRKKSVGSLSSNKIRKQAKLFPSLHKEPLTSSTQLKSFPLQYYSSLVFYHYIPFTYRSSLLD